MTDAWSHAAPAFALGFALGAAPGPVQLLILTQAARRGLGGGLRVMLGANLTLFAILVTIALGLSALEPSDAALRLLQLVGGVVLMAIAANETRMILADGRVPAEARAEVEAAATGRLGPTSLGVVAVLLNPGAWVFFASTASAALAAASADAGRAGALATATAMALGVSCSDLSFTILGSAGLRLFGARGLRWIRLGLCALLFLIGAGFVWQGVRGP
jgi:threonine/homoserine/homoserine lactone efflux protein